MNPAFPTPQANVYSIVPPQLPQALQMPPAAAPANVNTTNLTKAQRRMLGESEAARAKRLAKNAERMRQKRAAESYDEYKVRLAKNAETNRRRRQNESEAERALRHMRNAMRQRLRRAMETPDQKALRKARLAQRMREIRASETPEQRKLRLEKGAARARHKFLTETSEERMERNRKKAEYARLFRSTKQTSQTGEIQDLAPTKIPAQEIKPEIHPVNTTVPQQHTQIAHNPEPTSTNRDQTYNPAKNYPINYPDFGSAFPTFFNYPHLKNGHQTPYNPVYPSQSYYPDLTVPTQYLKNERTPCPNIPGSKSTDCLQPNPNPPKGTPHKH